MKHKFARRIAFAAGAYVALLLQSSAQLLVDGNPIPYSHSARGEGLGLSYVASDHDVGSVYWNPSSLAHLSRNFVSAGVFRLWDHTQMTGYAIVPLRIDQRNSFALGYSHTTIGAKWQDPEVIFRVIDLAYAYGFSEFFSIGVRLSLSGGESFSSTMWTTSGSVGVFYAPSSGLKYGASIEGLGVGIDYSRYQLTAVPSQTKIFRIGATFDFPLHKASKIIAFTISGEKHYGAEGYHFFLGSEVKPVRFLNLRIGYTSETESDPLFPDGVRYGIGIDLGNFILDYCASPQISSKRHDQFTVLFKVI